MVRSCRDQRPLLRFRYIFLSNVALMVVQVNYVLAAKGLQDDFPLFTAVHRICRGELSPDQLISCLRSHPAHS